MKDREEIDYRGTSIVGGQWGNILFDKHTLVDHRYADEFSNNFNNCHSIISTIIKGGDYIKIFGFLQFVIRHDQCPYGLAEAIDDALVSARAAYRVVNNRTITPVASKEEGEAVLRAFADLSTTEFAGARHHLARSSEELNIGNWSESVRESIHSVESVVRTIEPSNDLDKALKSLAKKGHIHPAMQFAMSKLYAYTSDQEGVRHAIVNDGEANVDEADALYMFGACAAFISYLINKARLGGLL